jgi:hypothetical protein
VSNDTPRGWKTAARDRVRRIIAVTPDGPVTGDDGAFLTGLLGRHPCAAEKIGPGVAWISIGPVPGYASRGLFVHRADGTCTDFSWRECITPTSHADQVRKAMRQAVAGQILDFQRQRTAPDGLLTCDATGARLPAEAIEIDHAPPEFTVLADWYASLYGGYDGVTLMPSQDGQAGRTLAPPHDAKWPAVHAAAARLQVLARNMHHEITRNRRSGS